jgi:hypothetical protein
MRKAFVILVIKNLIGNPKLVIVKGVPERFNYMQNLCVPGAITTYFIWIKIKLITTENQTKLI